MNGLRPYQQRAISMLRERYRDRPIISLPTGGGKTSIAAEIIRRALHRGHRAIFLVHRRELVAQAVERLAQFDVRAGRILAGHVEELELPVQVASIPTLIRRKHWPADLVIVDECAHATSASWSKCLDRYGDAWIIGLTATPVRLDGRGLGDLFGCIIEPVSTVELIDQGFLAEPTVYAPPVDLGGVRVRRGDYDTPQLAERMRGLTGSITDTWHERAFGMKTVVFAVNVEHSLAITAAFVAVGVRAVHLDGKTPLDRRAEILHDLKAGEVDIVSSVMVLSEGWDLPALQCAILARPTKSLALFRQMVGRIMRPPGPVVCLDHAGNHLEHGRVTDPIEWTLDGTERRKSDADPVRTCPGCFVILVEPGPCECGYVPDPAKVAEVEAAGELVELTEMPDRRAVYAGLLDDANAAGFKIMWARLRYMDTFGEWPRYYKLERARYKCSGHEFFAKETQWGRIVRCGRCMVRRTG